MTEKERIKKKNTHSVRLTRNHISYFAWEKHTKHIRIDQKRQYISFNFILNSMYRALWSYLYGLAFNESKGKYDKLSAYANFFFCCLFTWTSKCAHKNHTHRQRRYRSESISSNFCFQICVHSISFFSPRLYLIGNSVNGNKVFCFVLF